MVYVTRGVTVTINNMCMLSIDAFTVNRGCKFIVGILPHKQIENPNNNPGVFLKLTND
jgi:hypothetical protein